MTLASWGADLLDFFLPSGCVVCRDWIPSSRCTTIVCVACRTRLRAASWPRCSRCHHPRGTGRVVGSECLECLGWPDTLTAARYAYSLERPADDLVHALKYEGWRELGCFMGGSMVRLDLPDHASRGRSVVVPIPTTGRRLVERGYNQARLLADHFAAGLRLPVLDALVRHATARSQTSLTPDQRRDNVRGAFGPAGPMPNAVSGAHVLLVDDVLTTGATAGEAATVLATMGASSVTLVAFARALPSRPKRAA